MQPFFDWGKLLFILCHTDDGMFYTLLTVVGPKMLEQQNVVFIYSVFLCKKLSFPCIADLQAGQPSLQFVDKLTLSLLLLLLLINSSFDF